MKGGGGGGGEQESCCAACATSLRYMHQCSVPSAMSCTPFPHPLPGKHAAGRTCPSRAGASRSNASRSAGFPSSWPQRPRCCWWQSASRTLRLGWPSAVLPICCNLLFHLVRVSTAPGSSACQRIHSPPLARLGSDRVHRRNLRRALRTAAGLTRLGHGPSCSGPAASRPPPPFQSEHADASPGLCPAVEVAPADVSGLQQ